MADRLDNLKNAKCLVEAWEQKYGVGGHHTRWVNLYPSDVEWAVAEIERLREALSVYADKKNWELWVKTEADGGYRARFALEGK